MAKFTGASAAISLPGLTVVGEHWEIQTKDDYKETTDFSSGGNREYTFGASQWSGSFRVKEFPGKTQRVVGVGSFSTGTGQTGATGTARVYSGTILMGDCKIAVQFDDIVGWDVSFQGSGALTLPS